jgi:hypothetical protein
MYWQTICGAIFNLMARDLRGDWQSVGKRFSRGIVNLLASYLQSD